jgi:hypothetical protein
MAVGVGSVLAIVVALAFYMLSASLRGMDATVKAAVEAQEE